MIARARASAACAAATHNCASADDAKRWVEAEAAALDLPVEWVGGRPENE